MNLAVTAVRVSAHAVTQPPAVSDIGHATFYGTCAGLIIAVLVVLYFGEKIIPTDQHPSAVIYLGTVIGTMLALPVLALAGFVPDTFRTRLGVAAGTFVFLLCAFRVVVRNWGHEDGRRQAESTRPRPIPVWDASVILPSPESTKSVLTERERAAQVFAAAAHVIMQLNPDIIIRLIDSGQMQQEADRQARVGEQWMRVEPALLAVSAGYPLAAVRAQITAFHVAVTNVMKQSRELLAAAREGLPNDERDSRAESAKDALTSLASEWDRLVSSLHPEDPGTPTPTPVAESPSRAARNGRDAVNAKRRKSRHRKAIPPRHSRSRQAGSTQSG
jgi:hypothetical protein